MMQEGLQLTVNGVLRTVDAPESVSLLTYLRETLGLTGAKNGCDGSGTCGACTVLVNGTAQKSCQLKLADLNGAVVLTIEGLSEEGDHPIQRSFIDCGAVQCGFCTPGMILATKGLLDRTPHPTRDEIVKALSGNLCRCTGYAKIIEAVEAAARTIPAQGHDRDASGRIGGSMPRPDASAKVSGQAAFADDEHRDGDLVLRVVWPTHPHAQIISIDCRDARTVEGVVDVLTAAEIPGANAYGLIHRNQPVLCEDRVRFLGDPIALVIAESKEAAETAAQKVRVEMEPLQTVYEAAEALEETAPQLHAEGNVCCEYRLEHGSPQAVFEEAHLTVAGRYETPAVEHAYLEPEAGSAEWVDETLVVRAAAQYPQAIQAQVSEVLGLEKARVRIVSPAVGGAFGGKTDISVHALLALAAWRTKRRVRLTWTREESLRASVKRHPMVMDYRMAFDREGALLAVEGDILANAGAYESLSHPLLEQTAAFSTGPYRVPAVDVRVRGVYTNTPTSSAFRGFGIPQPTFAVESLFDEAAERLGLSPIELRRRNVLLPGDRSATGQIMREDTHVLEALEALEPAYEALRAEAADGNGVGIACGYKNVGLGLGESDHATAALVAHPDGTLEVRVGAVDVGQGSETIVTQLASERLGVDPRRVRVCWGDTAHTPDGRETNASRQTVVTGNAVLEAAEALAGRLLSEAQRLFPEIPAPIHYENGLAGADGVRHGWEEICARLDAPLEASVRYLAPDTSPLARWEDSDAASPVNYFAYTFFAHLAHVSVHPETGRTQVERLTSAFDLGRVIHRQAAEGQIEGGAVMGVGFALSEAYHGADGPHTTRLAQCAVPRTLQMPQLETIFVEAGDSVGPHGCKGIGEVAMIAVAPAITNAIHDAAGVRIRRLPATPSDIRAQRARESEARDA